MGIEKHIIKKAIVEIYVPSADNAMDLQNKTLSFFKEKICPLIEKIIERYSISGETIRIDKLELDFENFSPENSGLGELQKLEEQIEKKIINLISENRSDNFSGEILTAVKKIPKEKADEELFFHLLKTGTLPWWAKTEQPISIETLAQKIVLQPSDSFKKELTSILGVGAVRKRIAYKLSSESIEKIISLVFSASSDLLKYLNEILGFAKDDFSASENLRQILYEFILKKPSASSKAQFISDFIKEKNDFSLAEKLYTLANKSVSNEETLVYKEALADTNEYFSGNIKKIFTVKDVKMFFDKMEKSTNSTSEKEVEIDVSESVEVYEETGDYFIKNSGVIILAPYLPALFKALELWDGKAFVSDEAKELRTRIFQRLLVSLLNREQKADIELHDKMLEEGHRLRAEGVDLFSAVTTNL